MAAVFTAYAAVVTVEPFIGAPLYNFLSGATGDASRPDIALVHLGQGTVALALLAWPLALSLRRTRFGPLMSAVILIGAVAAPIVLNQHSAALALVVGGLVFWLAARFGPVAIRVGGLDGLKRYAPASTDARLDIWRLVSERVLQQPLRGWGLDASRLLPPPVQLHPHNGALQIWFELGAHGAVLTALIWWALFDLLARAARADRVGAAAAAAAPSAYLVIGALSFGVWQEWWLGLGAVAAAVCAALLVQRRWERLARPAGGSGLQPLGPRPL
jgi:O-antigen ligase